MDLEPIINMCESTGAATDDTRVGPATESRYRGSSLNRRPGSGLASVNGNTLKAMQAGLWALVQARIGLKTYCSPLLTGAATRTQTAQGHEQLDGPDGDGDIPERWLKCIVGREPLEASALILLSRCGFTHCTNKRESLRLSRNGIHYVGTHLAKGFQSWFRWLALPLPSPSGTKSGPTLSSFRMAQGIAESISMSASCLSRRPALRSSIASRTHWGRGRHQPGVGNKVSLVFFKPPQTPSLQSAKRGWT